MKNKIMLEKTIRDLIKEKGSEKSPLTKQELTENIYDRLIEIGLKKDYRKEAEKYINETAQILKEQDDFCDEKFK